MDKQTNLVSAGAGIAGRNKRYVVWFYLLNLVLAWFGALGFSAQAHAILDHSLYADRLLHGFDVAVWTEMLARPEFGPIASSTAPAMTSAALFSLASLLFMPGVLLGYASDHRLPRDEFFRACGRNVWRFVRLLLFFAIIAGVVSGILFGVLGTLVKAAETTTIEMLPFLTRLVGMAVIFLVLTMIRIWIDLAQTDVVLQDQAAVRKSITAAFRKTRSNLGRLLGSYVVIAIVAMAVLAAGLWLWNVIVPPNSVLGAFLISQAILLLLLGTRFWQRASAVAFYVRQEEPVIEMQPMSAAGVPSIPIAQ